MLIDVDEVFKSLSHFDFYQSKMDACSPIPTDITMIEGEGVPIEAEV